MSANYNESDISGVRWTRCFSAQCLNPLGGVKSIEFSEEAVIRSQGEVMISQTGSKITERLIDPGERFSLRNPVDGAVVGEATYGDVYVMLHGLYLHCAAKRDAAIMADEQSPPQGPDDP